MSSLITEPVITEPVTAESAIAGAPASELVCGYRWAGLTVCDAGTAHTCTRVSSEHRSHLCGCGGVELRTTTHLPTNEWAKPGDMSNPRASEVSPSCTHQHV